MNSSGLEGLDEELEQFLSDVRSRERNHSARIVELEAEVRRRDEELKALEAGLAAAESSRLSAEQEACARLGSLRAELSERDAASSRLALKAEELSARITSLEKELERERSASREKDVYIQTAKSAVKGRDAEFEKVWRMLEEARAETASWKARTAERDARLEAAAGENKALALEIRKLNNSLQQAALGFSQKLALVRRETPSAGGARSGEAPDAGVPGPESAVREAASGPLALAAALARRVSGFAGALRDRAESRLKASRGKDLKEPLGAIIRGLAALQERMEAAASLSGPAPLRLEPVDLVKIAGEALSSAASAQGLPSFEPKLSAPADLPPLRADRTRLREALVHVLGNAAEAMPGGGRISVEISRSRGGQVISVADDGPGVDAGSMPSLFEPFFSTKPGKLGLGLTIARSIIKSHGGDIAVYSGPDRGTRAEIFVPEAPEEG